MLVSTATQHVMAGGVEGKSGNRTVVYPEGVFAGLPLDVPDPDMGIRRGGNDRLLVGVSNHVCNFLLVASGDIWSQLRGRAYDCGNVYPTITIQ